MKEVYVITKGRGTVPLNNIWDTEFCTGTKCIDMSRSCYSIFECESHAREYLDRKLSELEDWIHKDIPEQAKKWTHGREHFLAGSQKSYEEIKKVISNMKIKKIGISD